MLNLKKEELSKLASPNKLGKAKVAAIYPHNLTEHIMAAPQAPFATFERENSDKK